MQNEKDRKRVTGYSISNSEDQLAKISDEMKIKEGGKNFKPVTPAEINDQLSSIFDDSQKRKVVCSLPRPMISARR